MLFSTDFVGARYCPQQLYTLFIFSIFILNILSYNTLNSNLDGLFIVKNTGNQYVSAPASGTNFVRVQIDIPDGYTLMGVIEANSSQSAVIPFAIKENSNTIMIRGRNVVNSVQETNLSATYILVKSSFIN